MLIKSVTVDNIHDINFIKFNISTFFSWFELLKLGCDLYTHATYMLSNMVVTFLKSKFLKTAKSSRSFIDLKIMALTFRKSTLNWYN